MKQNSGATIDWIFDIHLFPEMIFMLKLPGGISLLFPPNHWESVRTAGGIFFIIFDKDVKRRKKT
jgi:hypothetical protein